MPLNDTSDRHARLFALIHQQARAKHTALRLRRLSKRPLPAPDSERLMILAARSWRCPDQAGTRP